MITLTVEEFNSILLSNPELPDTMPDWFENNYTVSTTSNPSTSWFLYRWIFKEWA